jgi:hypothetical protein
MLSLSRGILVEKSKRAGRGYSTIAIFRPAATLPTKLL